MRKIFVLTAAMLLVLVSCKSSADSTSSATTSGAGAPAVVDDARAPGVTDDTIKVGVTYVDLESIKDLVDINVGDVEKAYQAVFDDINAKGGIHGRKLEPIFAPINPVGTASADAACTKLTQDDPVFVAVGFFLGDSVLCYVDTNETAAIGGNMTKALLAQAKAPWFSTDPSDDFVAEAVRTQAEAGALDGKLAVMATTTDQPLLDEQVKPLLDELDITPAETAVLDTPPGDSAAAQAAAQTLSERFKVAGIEKVLFVGNGAPATFVPGMVRTDFLPKLIFSDFSGAQSLSSAEGQDLSVLEGAIAAGPYGPDQARYEVDTPSTKACLEVQRSAGIVINPPAEVPEGEPNQFTSSALACTQMALLTAILQKAGPDLNYGTFQAAGASLGEIDLPTYPDPWTFGPAPHSDGDPVLYVFTWDPASGQFAADD